MINKYQLLAITFFLGFSLSGYAFECEVSSFEPLAADSVSYTHLPLPTKA